MHGEGVVRATNRFFDFEFKEIDDEDMFESDKEVVTIDAHSTTFGDVIIVSSENLLSNSVGP